MGSSSDPHVAIPRTLILMWKTKQLPNFAQKHREQWNRHLPVRILTDEDCERLATEQHVHDEYVRAPINVMRADLCRYMAIYEHGGLYADLDVSPSPRRPDEWVRWDRRLVVGRGWEGPKNLSNWFFGAVPRHPALADLVRETARRLRGLEFNFSKHPSLVIDTTGPGPFDAVLRPRCEERDDVPGGCHQYSLEEMSSTLLTHRSLSAGCAGYKEAPKRSASWARCRVAMRTAAQYNYSSWKFEARALYRKHRWRGGGAASEARTPRRLLNSVMGSASMRPQTVAVCATGHLRYFLHPSVPRSWEQHLLRRDSVRTDIFLVAHLGDGGNHPGWTDTPDARSPDDPRLRAALRRLQPWLRHTELLDGPSDCAEHAEVTRRAGLPAVPGHACRETFEQLFWVDYCVQLVRHKYSDVVGAGGPGYDLILRVRPDVAFTSAVALENWATSHISYAARRDGCGDDWLFSIPGARVRSCWDTQVRYVSDGNFSASEHGQARHAPRCDATRRDATPRAAMRFAAARNHPHCIHHAAERRQADRAHRLPRSRPRHHPLPALRVRHGVVRRAVGLHAVAR